MAKAKRKSELTFPEFDWSGRAKFVDLEDITATKGYYGTTQFRATPNNVIGLADVVQDYKTEYEENGEEALPPIHLMYVEDKDIFVVVDGYQRIEGAGKAGLTRIKAIVNEGTLNDAYREAYGANAAHGARRTNEDKRKAVKAALNNPELKDLSNLEISKYCRVSHTFVAHVRSESDDSPQTPRKRKDGRSYTPKGKTGPRKSTPKSIAEGAEDKARDKEEEPTETVESIRDANGVEVPDYIQDLFKQSAFIERKLKAIELLVKQVNSDVKGLGKDADDWEQELHGPLVQGMKSVLKKLRAAIKEARTDALPYAVDPYTKGRNPKPKAKKDVCRVTGTDSLGRGKYINRGWVTQQQWDDAPDELKDSEDDAWELGYWDRMDAEAERGEGETGPTDDGDDSTITVTVQGEEYEVEPGGTYETGNGVEFSVSKTGKVTIHSDDEDDHEDDEGEMGSGDEDIDTEEEDEDEDDEAPTLPF